MLLPNASLSTLVSARFMSQHHVECSSPKLPAGFASIDFTLNGQTPFSEDSVAFEIHSQVRHRKETHVAYHMPCPAGDHFVSTLPPRKIVLSSATPARGSIYGNLPVHVYGRGFSVRAATLKYLRCAFGNLSTAVFSQPEDTAVVCDLPPSRPGFVSVGTREKVESRVRHPHPCWLHCRAQRFRTMARSTQQCHPLCLSTSLCG